MLSDYQVLTVLLEYHLFRNLKLQEKEALNNSYVK